MIGKLLIISVAMVVLLSCSSETVKRTTYGTLQNIEQQECVKEFGRDCPEQEKYDDYQKRRDQELK